MLRFLRVLIPAAALGVLYLILRDRVRGAPAAGTATAAERVIEQAREPEPVLGYDGMDLGATISWLERADLDGATLREIRDYERRNRAREGVIEVVGELLDE